MRTKLALSSLLSRRCFLRFQIVYKIVHNVNCLDQLKNYQTELRDHNYTTERSLRDATQLDLGDTMLSAMGQSLFKFAAAKDWNHLSKELRELGSMSSFKTEGFKYLLELDQKQHVCTAKYYFFFFWIFIYIFNFCVRLPLILQIFSIHNSLTMFFDYYC